MPEKICDTGRHARRSLSLDSGEASWYAEGSVLKLSQHTVGALKLQVGYCLVDLDAVLRKCADVGTEAGNKHCGDLA